nr:hypothetical protein [uncultured Steroidobacter sp.]
MSALTLSICNAIIRLRVESTDRRSVESVGSKKNGKFYAAVPCVAVRIFSDSIEALPDSEKPGFYGMRAVNRIDMENFLLHARRKNFITKELRWRLKNLHLT